MSDFAVQSWGPIYSDFGDDPEMAELIEYFVKTMPAKIATFEECVAAKDWAAVERLAHQLKGSAGGYGFHSITQQALRVEQAARSNTPESELMPLIDDLLASGRAVRLKGR